MRTLAALVLLASTAHAQDGGVALDAGDARGPGDGGLELRVADFTLRASGYAQVDATLFSQASLEELNPATGQPLNELAVGLRHLHLGLFAARWLFFAATEVDASTVGGPGLRLYSAEVGLRWPEQGAPLVALRAGLLRIPFGADVQTLLLDRAFLEPTTMTQALFPGAFDVGLSLSGARRFLRYQVAVMNGEPVGDRALPAMDPNAAKDMLGRLGVAGAPWSRLRLEAGASALWGAGFHAGAPATKDRLTWHDANEDGVVQNSELQVLGGLPAGPSSNFTRFALGADLHVAVELPLLGTLDATGELIWATNLDRGRFVADPSSAGRDLRELGWALTVTQQLPLGFALGVRRDVYDPDADAAEQEGVALVPFDASVSTWAVMASWRWRRTARVLAEYDHQANALGRGPGGAPTTLGADRLTLRAEVSF